MNPTGFMQRILILSVLTLRFGVGCLMNTERVFSTTTKETMMAYQLLNPIVMGDHTDFPSEWNNTTATPMYLLKSYSSAFKGNASIHVKYDGVNWYIRVNAFEDKELDTGSVCWVYFDPKHNGTSKIPQDDDVKIFTFWVDVRGYLEFWCNIARGTGSGWSSNWDKLPNGTKLVNNVADSFVSMVTKCVVYEFRIPRDLVGGSDSMGFGAKLDINEKRTTIGECTWPSGFANATLERTQWPFDTIGILYFTGVPIPELGPSALMMLPGVILTMVTSIVRTRRRKTRVRCHGAFGA